MGCNCGGGGSALANYVVKDKNGTVIKEFNAVRQVEVTAFSAKVPGSTWHKTNS